MSGRLWTALRHAWRFVREWSGDSAYERYLESPAAGPRLSRQAFYLDALQRRYRGPSRCC